MEIAPPGGWIWDITTKRVPFALFLDYVSKYGTNKMQFQFVLSSWPVIKLS